MAKRISHHDFISLVINADFTYYTIWADVGGSRAFHPLPLRPSGLA